MHSASTRVRLCLLSAGVGGPRGPGHTCVTHERRNILFARIHNFTCAYRRPCARRRRVTVAGSLHSRLRDDHLHSFQSVRAIICGQPPSPRHKHIASHPPPLTPPSERTQHMAHEHLWGRRGAVVSACMQRLHLDPLHLWQSVAIRGNQRRQSVAPLHLDPLHLVRSGRGSRATPSLCRGRSTGNWRSARPRS